MKPDASVESTNLFPSTTSLEGPLYYPHQGFVRGMSSTLSRRLFQTNQDNGVPGPRYDLARRGTKDTPHLTKIYHTNTRKRTLL